VGHVGVQNLHVTMNELHCNQTAMISELLTVAHVATYYRDIRKSKEASKITTSTKKKSAGESIQEKTVTEQPLGILSLADIGELDSFRSKLSDNQGFTPDYHHLFSSGLDLSDEETEKTSETAS